MTLSHTFFSIYITSIPCRTSRSDQYGRSNKIDLFFHMQVLLFSFFCVVSKYRKKLYVQHCIDLDVLVWSDPRFKRLFANGDDAKDLTWHANGTNCDGMIRYPADSSQWKKIDRLYPDFGKEARNLRLGIATNEMNPYGSLSTQHSLWPVLLVIYNLPPWL